MSSGHADRPSTPVLVVGGCGFLGSHIVEAFTQKTTYSIVVASRNPKDFRLQDVEYRAVDIANSSEVSKLVEATRPRVIVHAATLGPFAMGDVHMEHYNATRRLLEMAKKCKHVKAFVYTGSSSTVSNLNGATAVGLKEDQANMYSLQSGPTPYARTKSATQAMVLEFNTKRSDGLSTNGDFSDSLVTTVLCVPGIYGPRDTAITPRMLNMPTWLQLGPNDVLHEWSYVENVAHAHVLAASALLTPKSSTQNVDGEWFFISDGHPIPFWDFARNIKLANSSGTTSGPGRVVVVPWWIVLRIATVSEWLGWIFTFGKAVPALNHNLVRYLKNGAYLDISKARERLGYEPVVDTNEGIRRAVRWVRNQSDEERPSV
ncbi:C-3 sterol dehydrogenase/C-4 decarboxylase-like protein [Lophiotrema nucula]|uniref:C-3 sterol dehydrogenase/C-4 decarboxylase-like protein n=1 Tax=Lophiotrema nucula TaxID=690887 RepID=A0A6A5YUC9_9PLEO|nr:C-3 sterol dehydrogenase/C-4 decarboxylase-like protein [Lophiotrema nucula]